MDSKHDTMINDSPIVETHFAGRLGGNQAFIADPNDQSFNRLVKKQPDAVGRTSRTN